MVLRRILSWRSGETGRPLWPWAVLSAAGLGVAIAALGLSPPGVSLEQKAGLWMLFRLRGPVAPPDDMVIIAMRRDAGERISILRSPPPDQPCVDLRVGQVLDTHETLGSVPERWGRCHYVELLRRLALARPAVTALDVVFQPRSDRPAAEDRLLAQAIRDAGVVVSAQALRVRKGQVGALAGTDDDRSDYLVALSRDIGMAVGGAAPMPLPRDSDSRVDRFWTFKEHGWVTPSLAALSLQAYLLDAYPLLRSAVAHLSPSTAADLPDAARLDRSAGQLQTHMLVVRRLLFDDAALTAALRDHPGQRDLHLSPLIAMYTGDAVRKLNFFGPAGTIRTVDITQLLATPTDAFDRDPFGLRGKIVFIGYAEDVEWEERENFSTVFDRGTERLSGVEITATAFSNLLHGSDLVTAPAALSFMLTCLAGASIALLGYATGAVTGLAASVLLALAYVGVAVAVFAHSHLALPVFFPAVVSCPAALALAFTHKYVNFKQDRATLRYILEQLVPREVVDLFRANARQLGSLKESVKAACVMTDVEGYTALSNRLSPDEVSQLLGEYFAAIFRPVADHGGFVSDLKGDSILALWTDRTQDGVVRARVCQACLDLQRAVDQFNSQHPGTPLPTRIGVNYGDVSVGPVGAPGHFEYRAVGDTVNTASRVEQLSKDLGTRLLVTDALAHELTGYLFRPLGAFALRGRRSVTLVHELICRREDALDGQIELCRSFATALDSYTRGERSVAQAQFEALLGRAPDDGPTLYYLRLLGDSR